MSHIYAVLAAFSADKIKVAESDNDQAKERSVNMMNKKIEIAPVTEILERIQAQESKWLATATENEKKSLVFTYDTNIFYLRMLSYALENGEECPEGLMLRLTVDNMVNILQYSGGMTQKSLSCLSKCGVIKRVDENGKSAPVKGRLASTILKREFYEMR